ncbi:MAG: hypothetical protein O2970_12085 [Proteobacteria bacterium]|nr:hypothetical protein [Pseudomonadota bacterium]MDG4544518.1 hypothetical protein [Rickettsiales bacterium]
MNEKKHFRYIAKENLELLLNDKNRSIYYSVLDNFTSSLENVVAVLPPSYSSKALNLIIDRRNSKETFYEKTQIEQRKLLSENKYIKIDNMIKNLEENNNTETPILSKQIADLKKSKSSYANIHVSLKGLENLYKFMHDDEFIKSTYKREINMLEGDSHDAKETKFIYESRAIMFQHLTDTITKIGSVASVDKLRGNISLGFSGL